MESGSAPAAPADRSARLGAAIAAGSGILLFVSLFIPWYTVFGSDIVESVGEGPLGDIADRAGEAIGLDVRDEIKDRVTVTGWESFEITDVVCAAAAAIAAIRGAVAVFGEDDDPSIPGSVLTLAFGAAALALVLYRIVNPPGIGEEREIGVWVGAFAAGGIVYGSYIAMRSGKDPPRDRPPV
jgi:hypothetical protein